MLKTTFALLAFNLVLSACAFCADDPEALRQQRIADVQRAVLEIKQLNSSAASSNLGALMRAPEVKSASEQEREALLNYSLMFGAFVVLMGAGLFAWHRHSTAIQRKNRRVNPRPVEESTNTRAKAVAEYFRKKSETVEQISE